MNQAVVAAPSLTSDCFKWCFVLGGKRSWGLCSASLPVLICLIPAFSPESCDKIPQPAAMGASQLRESGCTFLSDWFIMQLFSLINFVLNTHTPETKKWARTYSHEFLQASDVAKFGNLATGSRSWASRVWVHESGDPFRVCRAWDGWGRDCGGPTLPWEQLPKLPALSR